MTGFSRDECCASRQSVCFDPIFSYEFCCLAETPSQEAAVAVTRLYDCVSNEFHCIESFAPWKIFLNDVSLSYLTQSHKSDLAHYRQYTGGMVSGLVEAATECPLGTAAFLCFRLHDIEKELGQAHAQYLYTVLKGALSVSDTGGCVFKDLLLAKQRLRVLDLFYAGPHFRYTCPPDSPKLFLLDFDMINTNPYECYVRSGFWASEVLFERFMRRSECRFHSPDEADVILVPMYKTCHLLRQNGHWYGEGMVELGEEVHRALSALDQDMTDDKMKKVVFMHGSSSLDIAQFRPIAEIFANSKHLTVEPRPVIVSELFDRGHPPVKEREVIGPVLPNALVIPPVVQLEMRYRLLTSNNHTSEKRMFFASFHGSHADTLGRVGAEYRRFNATLRTDLLATLARWTNTEHPVVYGGVSPDYAYTMGNSVFCLAPKGSSSYTARLYEALFSGCIPVLLSDDYVFPFSDVIPWSDMVIRIDEAAVPQTLEILVEAAKNLTRLVHIRATIEKFRCHVDWMELDSQCSAYNSILRTLGK